MRVHDQRDSGHGDPVRGWRRNCSAAFPLTRLTSSKLASNRFGPQYRGPPAATLTPWSKSGTNRLRRPHVRPQHGSVHQIFHQRVRAARSDPALQSLGRGRERSGADSSVQRKNKTFFFFAYRASISGPTPGLETVPTVAPAEGFLGAIGGRDHHLQSHSGPRRRGGLQCAPFRATSFQPAW